MAKVAATVERMIHEDMSCRRKRSQKLLISLLTMRGLKANTELTRRHDANVFATVQEA